MSFNALKYNFNSGYKAQEMELKSEIDTFTKTHDNAQYLGKGVFAKAYTLNKFPNIVIKESIYDNEKNFDAEAYNLREYAKK